MKGFEDVKDEGDHRTSFEKNHPIMTHICELLLALILAGTFLVLFVAFSG